MNKQQKKLLNSLSQFKNMKCIKAEVPVGDVLYFHFGRLTELFLHQKDNKIHLSGDYKIYFDWQWSIERNKEIIASSRIENDNDYFITNNIVSQITDKILIDFTYSEGVNELTLFFEDGYIIRSYNDIPRKLKSFKYIDNEVFAVFTPTDIYLAKVLGKLLISSHTVKYVNDFEQNPDKYFF